MKKSVNMIEVLFRKYFAVESLSAKYIAAGGVFLLALALGIILRIILQRISRAGFISKRFEIQAIFRALATPVLCLCILLGLLFAADLLAEFKLHSKGWVSLIWRVSSIIFFSTVALSYISIYEKYYIKTVRLII